MLTPIFCGQALLCGLYFSTSVSYVFIAIKDISIDITERDPTDNPSGIPYRLLAEVCSPGIDITNFASIFEEHRICKSLSQWQQQNKVWSRTSPKRFAQRLFACKLYGIRHGMFCSCCCRLPAAEFTVKTRTDFYLTMSSLATWKKLDLRYQMCKKFHAI